LLVKQLEREQSLLRRFGHITRTSRGNTGGFRSQRIPQFESYHPSHAVGLADVRNTPGSTRNAMTFRKLIKLD
jgi:hypothetical protein